MSRFYKISSPYDEDCNVKIVRKVYQNNGNLALQLITDCGEPYAMLTVNLSNKKLPMNTAYVDTNNLPQAEEFINKYGLGRHLGKFAFSGYCCYPLYEFHVEMVED